MRPLRGAPRPDDGPAVRFARGISLGALVGAAIAGSAIWRELRGARRGPRGARSVGTAASDAAARAAGDRADATGAEGPSSRGSHGT